MLGADYAGYFPGRRRRRAGAPDRPQLFDERPSTRACARQCAARAPLFAPAAEQAALLALVDNLLLSRP
jgi:hypothetical protein